MIEISGEQKAKLVETFSEFKIIDKPIIFEQNFSGHINSTYIVTTESSNKYVLQKINTNIFKDPDELMENIVGVTDFIRRKLTDKGIDASRRTLKFIPDKSGKYYHYDSDMNCWRLYHYVDKVTSYMSVDNPELFYKCGLAFGEFQQLLSDYPADKLHETIKNFHNTVSRLDDFKKAVAADVKGRKKLVEKEVDFVLQHEALCSYITSRISSGTYPLRVTHNDTKLNNILMDNDTNEGICVIDLDTVMPGSILYDFGDSIRFGASSSPEDEKDLDKVYMQIDLYEEYTKGFLKGTNGSLSKEELLGLPYGALVMTLETGMRFLGDYLNGDVYFSIHYPEQNLDRARTQLKLVSDMEGKLDIMTDIIKKYANID